MQQTGEIVLLEAPLGGLFRGLGYQQKPPYFSEDMLNVRAFDTIEGRGRIGSRPGLAKAFAQQLTPGPDVIVQGTFASDSDWTKGTGWTIAAGVATAAGAISTDLTQINGPLIVGATYTVTYSYTRTAGSISAVCGTTAGSVNSAASGSISESIICAGTTGFKFVTVGFTGTVDNVTAKMTGGPIRMAGVIRSLATPHTATFADEFTGSSMSGNWSHPSWTLDSVASNGLPTVASGYSESASSANNLRAAALADQSVATGTYREVSVSWRDPGSNRSTGKTNDPTDYAFDDANVADWTTLGIVAGTDAVQIYSGNNVTAGIYTITAVAAGQLTLATSPSPLGVFGQNVVYRLLLGTGKVYLCMDMNNTTPVASTSGTTGSVVASISTIGASLRTIKLYVHGTQVGSTVTQDSTAAETQTLRMSIDPSNVVRVYSKQADVPALTYAIMSYTPAGGRVGFGLRTNGDAVPSQVDWFRFTYTGSAVVSPPESVVLSANGQVWREAPAGTLAADVVENLNGYSIAPDRRIYSATRLQSLYIADYTIRVEGTAGFTDTGGTVFDDAAVSDWTVYGVDYTTDALEIVSGTGVNTGVYSLSAPTSGTIVIGPSANTVGGVAATAIKYRILRWIKVFDASVNPPTLQLMSKGTIAVSQPPAGCRSVTLWQDRLWWCNNALTPHGWWASAAGYPTNYDYGDTGAISPPGTALGVSAAVNGTQAEFAGLIGEPLVTIIPINDDLAVFACKTSFYYMMGNPRLGGSIHNISREIGIVDIEAWCRTADGRLIVLTPDGLYDIQPQQGGAKQLSRDFLPQEMIGLTDDRYDVSLAFDVARRGVLISASGKEESIPSVHYFYGLRTGAYLPQSFARTQDPTAVVSYQPSGIGMPSILWGGRDGYVRRFEDAAQTDDGTNFNSRVLYGPIRLGAGEYEYGILHELVCVLDVTSGSVTLTIHVGHSAQAAKTATARYTTTMTAGRNRNRYPRLRGGAVYVKITGTPGSRWAMESLTITRERVGRLSVV